MEEWTDRFRASLKEFQQEPRAACVCLFFFRRVGSDKFVRAAVPKVGDR